MVAAFDVMRDELGSVHRGFSHSVYCVAGTQVGVNCPFDGVFNRKYVCQLLNSAWVPTLH